MNELGSTYRQVPILANYVGLNSVLGAYLQQAKDLQTMLHQ